jgi:hypothetical protein
VRCCRCTTSTFPEVKSGDEGLLQAGDVLLEGGPSRHFPFHGHQVESGRDGWLLASRLEHEGVGSEEGRDRCRGRGRSRRGCDGPNAVPLLLALNTETTGPRRDRSVSGLERLAPACLIHSGCDSRLLRRALSSETARRELGDLGCTRTK